MESSGRSTTAVVEEAANTTPPDRKEEAPTVPIVDPPGEKQIIKSPHSPAEIEQAGELLLGARDTVRDCQKDLDLLNLVLEKIHNQMRGLTPEFRRTVLTAALEKAKRELRPIAAFAALEADVRSAVDGLDLKTRAIIGMLAQMVGTDGGAEFGDAIRDELENDAEAIDEARRQAGDDPTMRTLYRAYRLARRINGQDDDIDTEQLFAQLLEEKEVPTVPIISLPAEVAAEVEQEDELFCETEAQDLAEELREPLRPCPLCGRQPGIEELDQLVWLVRCKCGLVFNPDPNGIGEALNKAAAARTAEMWNQRVTQRK